jgi:hypothetical protein
MKSSTESWILQCMDPLGASYNRYWERVDGDVYDQKYSGAMDLLPDCIWCRPRNGDANGNPSIFPSIH